LLPGIGPSTAAKILDNVAAERKVVKMLKQLAVPRAFKRAEIMLFIGIVGMAIM
jgi:hypothetical protein